MIAKKGKTISSIYKGSQAIGKIYKGTLVVYESFKNLLASGVPPLTIYSKGEDLIDYKIFGNSVQDGTPTPETPIEVESVGVRTKNVFDLSVLKNENSSIRTLYEFDGDVVTVLSSNTIAWAELQTLSLKPNTKYCLSVDNLTNIDIRTPANNRLFNQTTTTSATFTTNDTGLVCFKMFAPTGAYPHEIGRIQLEEGETATEYEPFGYKVPVKVRGKNLFDSNILLEHGFALQEDGSYWLKASGSVYKKILFVNESKYEGQMTISYDIKYILYNNTIGAIPYVYYTDGTYEGTFNMNTQKPSEYAYISFTTASDKIVDYVAWSYGTGSTQTYIKNMQIEYGIGEIESKNLFDGNYKNGYISSGKLYGFSENVGNQYLVVVSCEPNTKYIVSKEYSTARFSVCFADEYPFDQMTVSNIVTKDSAKSIINTSASTSKYLIAFIYNKSVDTLPLPNIQVQKVNTTTKCTPYVEPTTTNIYLNEPLRKLGDYSDYIDFENNKVVRNIYQGKLIDIIYGSSGSQYANGLCRKQGTLKPSPKYDISPMSNCLKGYSGSLKTEANTISLLSEYLNGYVYFNVSDVGLEPVTTTTSNKEIGTAINNYITEKDIDLIYVLATPTEETIELPNIPTIKGTTVIEIDTTIQPSNLEVVYKGK